MNIECPKICPISYDLYCQAEALAELVLPDQLEELYDVMMNHIEECQECMQHKCSGKAHTDHINDCEKCFKAIKEAIAEKKELLQQEKDEQIIN